MRIGELATNLTVRDTNLASTYSNETVPQNHMTQVPFSISNKLFYNLILLQLCDVFLKMYPIKRASRNHNDFQNSC